MTFKKGNIPWNKGLPKEQQPAYGYKHTEKTKQKIRESKLGKPNPHKGYIMSEEAKRKLSIAHTGKKLSEEHKQKLRDRLKIKHPMTGRKHSEESKRKMSNAKKGKKLTEEHKRKIAIAARKTRLNRSPFPQKNTNIEKLLQEGLNKNEIKYEKHITVCNICQPDIVFPDKKIAVFADGDYWHSREFKNGKTWEKDREQDKILKENGWSVLRFWGSEIKNNPEECINKILESLS